MIAEFKGIITAPRWMKVPTALRNICFERAVKCDLDIDKGWITETVRFTLTGDKQKIAALRWSIRSVIEESGGTVEIYP